MRRKGRKLENSKQIARLLYLKGDHSQAETAELAGVSEVTLNRWAKAGDWRKLKAAKLMGRDGKAMSRQHVALMLKEQTKQAKNQGSLRDQLSELFRLEPPASDAELMQAVHGMVDSASNQVITQAIHSGRLSAQHRAHDTRLLAKDFGSTLKEIEEMPGRKEILSQLKPGRPAGGQDRSR